MRLEFVFHTLNPRYLPKRSEEIKNTRAWIPLPANYNYSNRELIFMSVAPQLDNYWALYKWRKL